MGKYDFCVKVLGSPDIWMVRDRTESRVKFKTWQEYVDAGKPPFEIVSQEELDGYREASYFRG